MSTTGSDKHGKPSDSEDEAAEQETLDPTASTETSSDTVQPDKKEWM
jgi:hypothetical protein